ncbi:primase-like DNA-binding domain-containing protein [Bacillus tropicus]|uniref:primase-like DNA-binding domain-containing protein n=1 Tax=Bacillus tropicus TaxID=2026188 RepID=UPI003D25A9C2
MVGDFIRDKIVRDIGVKISHKDLYEKYVEYCKNENEKPCSKNKFGRMMKAFDFGASVNYCGIRMHKGIRLKEE